MGPNGNVLQVQVQSNAILPDHAPSQEVPFVVPEQEVPQVPEVFLKEKAGKSVASGGVSGEKKEKPKFCFRCYKPGHKKEECTANILCKICLSTDHLTAKCTVYKNPRPMASPVGYEVNGLGFYHIPFTPPPNVKTDNKSALVKVAGGTLSIPQLVQELARLISEKWNWQVNQLDKNSFMVPFPSRADLQRSVAFGKADIKEHGVSLLFEEWKEEDEGAELDNAWIRVFLLPKKLRVYPVLWAIGSMLGATQDVDMLTTDENDFGRINVAVMDIARIPRRLEPVIGKKYYVVHLQVEGRDPDPVDHMDMDGSGENGRGNGRNKDQTEKEGETKENSDEPKELQEKQANMSQSNNTRQQDGDPKNTNAVLIEEIDGIEDDFNVLRSSNYPKKAPAVQAMSWDNAMPASLRMACGLEVETQQMATADGSYGPAAVQIVHSRLPNPAGPAANQMEAGLEHLDRAKLMALQSISNIV
ncbi:hypothetical protein EJB05_25770, partial [Eragrostis curvula]